MNAIVIYRSKTGFTKRYAQWLAEDLGCEAAAYENRDKVELSGELTLLGITRPETFQVTVTPEGPAFRLVAEGEIRRSDFGMTGDLPLVSDAVTITVSTIAVAG